MRFTQISEVRGDETSSYKVDGYKSTTVREFVEEVLIDKPQEWGYIAINGSFVANKNRCEYKWGKLIVPFPDESILDKTIISVTGDGGWSRMDYQVYVN